jgi:hypothetical protein
MTEGTVAIYVGDTGTGKTYLALEHFKSALAATGRPGLIIDSMAARNFDDVRGRYPAGTVDETTSILYDRHRHAIYNPETPEDLEVLWGEVKRRPDPLCIFIDETSPWLSAHLKPANLMYLIRSHRHRGHHMFLTTQYLGDFPPAVLQCLTKVFIFRSTAPQTLERLQDTFPRLDLARIQELPDREHIAYDPRVPWTRKAAPPACEKPQATP